MSTYDVARAIARETLADLEGQRRHLRRRYWLLYARSLALSAAVVVLRALAWCCFHSTITILALALLFTVASLALNWGLWQMIFVGILLGALLGTAGEFFVPILWSIRNRS